MVKNLKELSTAKEPKFSTDDERRDALKKLIEEGHAIIAGDSLVIEVMHGGKKVPEVLGVFVRKTNDGPVISASYVDNAPIYLATQVGMPLFEATDLYKMAIEKTRKIFMGNFDEVIATRLALIEKAKV